MNSTKLTPLPQIKFQQFSPTITILFLEMLRGLRDMIDDELELTSQIRDALGDDISVLAETFTELRVFIPPEKPRVPELDNIESKVVLQRAVGKWMALVMRVLEKDVMFIFVDDLKANDDNNILLMKELFQQTQTPLFFFFGLRDDDLDNKTGQAVDMLSSSSIHRIILPPLNITDVSRIIAEMLGAQPAEIMKLAELLNRKTKGNPFFISQVC